MNTQQQSSTSTRYIPVLFTITIFVSASLLFFVQPLFTKIVLPNIGGAPAVWTTAMLFFQTALIVGYLYAHLLTKYVSVWAQVAIHTTLWIAALFFLPLAIPDGWFFNADQPVVSQTLILFALGVGLPFTALSANAPLIQSWYSKSKGPSADDPYFLYGASNLGSLIALLAFPLVAEPFFGATKIGIGWAVGFVILGLLLFVSGFSVSRNKSDVKAENKVTTKEIIKLKTLFFWAFIAFIPSSLMLAVTTKISMDVGSLPLVWVVPLSLYLLSFVFTFRTKPLVKTTYLRIVFLVALVPMILVFTGSLGHHLNWTSVVILITGFFIITLFVHQKLYENRPSSAKLTVFYLTMSVGGALGGVFNSIFAPLVFDRMHEGIITLGLAILLLLSETTPIRLYSLFRGAIFGAAMVAALVAILVITHMGGYTNQIVGLSMCALIALILLRKDTISVFASLSVIAIFANHLLIHGGVIYSRSFFGPHLVVDLVQEHELIANTEDGVRVYTNGTTIHGAQRLVDIGAEHPRPTSYYDVGGAIAQVIDSEVAKSSKTIGIVGLGVGVIACYKQPGQDWHFYEIDKHVDDIARNPDLFTYMSSCAGDSPTYLGDARVILNNQDIKFDILMLDAFSSDSIPTHLMTLEAIEMYLDKLNEDGILIFHVSNRYYNAHLPVVRAIDELGLVGRLQFYKQDIPNGKLAISSNVVIFARSEEAFGALADDPRWSKTESDGGDVWTDDFANPLSILE